MLTAYFASTQYSTLAAGTLCAMHNLKSEIPLNQTEEFKLWQKSVILPTRASSIFALAKLAKEKGLNAKVIVGSKDYSFPDYRFFRYSKSDIDTAKLTAKLHRIKAEKAGIEIEENPNFTLEEVKEELTKNKLILLRINVKNIREIKRNSSNYVLIYDYNKDKQTFHIFDPALSAKTISEQDLNEALNSLEEKKHRDKRMLILGK